MNYCRMASIMQYYKDGWDMQNIGPNQPAKQHEEDSGELTIFHIISNNKHTLKLLTRPLSFPLRSSNVSMEHELAVI